MRKLVWLIISCLMVLSLMIVSCGEKETEEKSEIGDETGEKPEYGGMLTLAIGVEPTFDLLAFGAAYPQMHAHQKLYEGDWAKGLAGGYGEGLTTWGQSTNIPELNIGYLTSEHYWEVSDNGSEVTTYFTIRDNIYFAKPDTEAGDLVGGRKLTVDDLVWNVNQRVHNENAQNFQLYPFHRYPEAVKIDEKTFSITHKFADHMSTLMRENCSTYVFAPELWDAYGYESCTEWEYSVGTGPFMLNGYTPGNAVELIRNPDCWMTDPVGPGKGNRLPYIDNIKYIIMIDESTRHAALRTAQIDQLGALTPEDKDLMIQTAPKLVSAERGSWSETPLFMNTTKPPFNDIRVRKAMMMATDFNAINDALYEGAGDIISWPYFDVEGYEPLFVTLEDSDLPAEVKALYTYNVEGAKNLLADAGLPTGFKTTLVMQQTDVDYYSIIADQWSKVGIEIEMQPMEFGNLISTAATASYDGLIAIATSPNSSYPEQSHYAAQNWVNASLINDPYVNEQADKVRALAITDFQASMELCRPLIMYLLGQAYMVPSPRHTTYSMWWPWLKNYSGENAVGYFPGNSWAEWCWIDENLKNSMGH